MINKTIHTIINQLKEGNSKEKAYLGFFQYGGGTEESCIKANKEGLLLYASCIFCWQVAHNARKRTLI